MSRRTSRITGDEAGYSIVEVMVAILILLVAILPMFKMFDIGLSTATKSRNYDLAQSLAEKQAELVQANSYADVRDKFPDNASAYPGISCSGSITGSMDTSSGRTVPSCRDTSDAAYNNFTFSVNKRYVKLADSGGDLQVPATDAAKMIQVTIAVTRTGDSIPLFTTTGIVYE